MYRLLDDLDEDAFRAYAMLRVWLEMRVCDMYSDYRSEYARLSEAKFESEFCDVVWARWPPELGLLGQTIVHPPR